MGAGLACAPQGVWPHPWLPPTRWYQHFPIPVVTAKNVSTYCQGSRGGQNHPRREGLTETIIKIDKQGDRLNTDCGPPEVSNGIIKTVPLERPSGVDTGEAPFKGADRSVAGDEFRSASH